MQPNHLWPDSSSLTLITAPVEVDKTVVAGLLLWSTQFLPHGALGLHHPNLNQFVQQRHDFMGEIRKVKVKVKACRPGGSPVRAQANKMQDFTRSTIVQNEKYKITFQQHPIIICSSLRYPIVKAFPDGIFVQCPLPSGGRSPAFPRSSDVSCQNPPGCPCFISGLLRMYVCYINCLHTSCWDAWKIHLKQCNRKNSMGFGREDELKNNFWLPTFACKKRWPQGHYFGSSAWIFPMHLTKLIGMHYGLRWDNMESRSIWLAWS